MSERQRANVSCLSETMVAALARGALGAEERRSADEHLARCAECRRLVSELARLGPDEGEAHAAARVTAAMPEHVTEALDADEPARPLAPPPLRSRMRSIVAGARARTRLLVAGGALVAILLGLAARRIWRALGDGAATETPRALAILDPRALGGEPAWMAVAAGELLRLELAERGGPRVVSGDATARATVELLRGRHDDTPRLPQLRRRLGVDALLLGSLSPDGKQIRLELRSPPRAIVSQSGDEILTLTADAGQQLRRRLGLEPLDEVTLRRLRARLPTGVALRWWAEALLCHRGFDEAGARDRLLQAAEAAPQNAAVQAALLAVWDALGDRTRAAMAARRALALGDQLSFVERAAIAARLHELGGERQAAIAAWRQLHDTFPDEAAYRARLADALERDGRSTEALELLRGPLRGGDGDEAALQLALARAALASGDVTAARRAAEAAARAASAVGATAIAAAARRVAGAALARGGDLDAALAAADDARVTSARLGDDGAQADALLEMGVLCARLHRFNEARARFEEARELAVGAGDTPHLRAALDSLALLDARVSSGAPPPMLR